MKKIYFIFNLQFLLEGGYYFGGFLEIQINCILSKGRIDLSLGNHDEQMVIRKRYANIVR